MSTPPNPFGPPPGGPGVPPPGGRGPAPFGGSSPFGGPGPSAGGQSPFGPPGGTSGAPGGAPSTASAASATAAGPPTILLVLAGVIAAAGIVIGAVFWGSWIAAIGWLLAGPIAIGVVAVFIAKDTARRAQPIYLRPSWITAAYAVVMVLVAAGVIVGALGFAFWMGRR